MAGGLIIPDGATSFCTWCKAFFGSWTYFKRHLGDVHCRKKMRSSRRCPHCLKVFRHATSLQHHVATGCHAFPYPVTELHINTKGGDQQDVSVLLVPWYEDTDTLEPGILRKE